MRTVIYSMGASLDCYIAGPDGNDWGALMPSCTASTNSRQASSASIYSDDASSSRMVSTSDSLLTDLLHQRCVM